MKRILSNKAMLPLGAWLAYIMVLIPLHHLVGHPALALSALPVVVAGGLLGMRVGILAGLLAFPLNLLLAHLLAKDTGEGLVTPTSLMSTALIILLGAVAGWVHNLDQRTKQELARHKQTEETLEQRATQLALLNDISRKIAAVLEIDRVLDQAARLVQERFGYDNVNLLTVDRKQDELVVRAIAGSLAHLFPSGHRLKQSQGMIGWASRHGETLLANDVNAEPRYFSCYPDLIPTQSELSVPIRVGEDIVGVLDVQSPHLNAFDENDVMVIEILADQIAVALENARLYQAVERELARRERMNEALRENEKRFRSITETAGDAIIIFDSQENIFFWNRAAKDIFGYRAGDTRGRLLDSIMPRRFSRALREEMEQVISTGESDLVGKTIEVAGIRKDGSEFPLELSLATWKIGEETYFTAIARDVTERRQAEESLERRAVQLALINDISGKIAGVLELDSVLDRAARLVQENFGYHHVALFVLDRERDELVMRASAGDFAHLFSPDHRLKLGQGMVGWVGQRGGTLLANDVDAEPRYVNLYPDVLPTRSELSVSIRVGEEIVGVLDVQSPHLNAFDENDVMVMETLDAIAPRCRTGRCLWDAPGGDSVCRCRSPVCPA
jgi:PAS domain S-box-containing protein